MNYVTLYMQNKNENHLITENVNSQSNMNIFPTKYRIWQEKWYMYTKGKQIIPQNNQKVLNKSSISKQISSH